MMWQKCMLRIAVNNLCLTFLTPALPTMWPASRWVVLLYLRNEKKVHMQRLTKRYISQRYYTPNIRRIDLENNTYNVRSRGQSDWVNYSRKCTITRLVIKSERYSLNWFFDDHPSYCMDFESSNNGFLCS